MGSDLLDVVKESCLNHHMLLSLNSTFITLIPKVEYLISFDDFRPMSLHNEVYKVITK